MTKGKINILVTGCGGDIGQSVGKILNTCNLVNKLYGCDISENNAAKFIYSNFFIGLPCKDQNYISSLEEIVKEKNIEFIIPVSEHELRLFTNKNISKIGKSKLILASLHAREIGFDKLLTAEFLKSNNLPFPITFEINDFNGAIKFPVILKSRTGSGSSNINIVRDNESFDFIKKRNPGFIIQEYLDDNNGEYTCGLFRGKNGDIKTIIIRRELMGSQTGYGEIIYSAEIDSLLHEIAKKLNLNGSINVQLRITTKGPKVFEINPRFSSTVLFRHLLGFKDLEWSIKDELNLPINNYINNSIGKKIYKGFSEYIN